MRIRFLVLEMSALSLSINNSSSRTKYRWTRRNLILPLVSCHQNLLQAQAMLSHSDSPFSRIEKNIILPQECRTGIDTETTYSSKSS